MRVRILLACLAISGMLAAQPVVKLYGYSQEYTPGNIPVNVPDENGNKQPRRSFVTTNYYIYVSVDTKTDIQLQEVWVGGKWDTVISQQVVATPVVVSYPVKKTLVASTKQKVLQLNKGDSVTRVITPSVSLKKMMKGNELIVAYLWKGKKYYAALRKLSVLPVLHGI